MFKQGIKPAETVNRRIQIHAIVNSASYDTPPDLVTHDGPFPGIEPFLFPWSMQKMHENVAGL